MAIGIDPTVDYAFKLILGSPEHPAITLHFLNAVLGDDIQITEVEILNPILGKADDADKLSILDVAARDANGRLLELPKYVIPSDNSVITDPIEAWLYFFRRASGMTTEDIQQRFRSSAFNEAAEVLDMIQRTPQQRNQYELRLKAQRDERARLEQARAEGEARGEARGEVSGRIKTLRELLGVESTSLDGLSLEQLLAIANELQRQLRDRGV